MTKISYSSSLDSSFQAQNAPKSVFGQGSASDPAGGAYNVPPNPIVSWGGRYPLPIPPPRRLRRLELSSYGASVLRLPHYKFLAKALQKITVLRNAIRRERRLQGTVSNLLQTLKDQKLLSDQANDELRVLEAYSDIPSELFRLNKQCQAYL